LKFDIWFLFCLKKTFGMNKEFVAEKILLEDKLCGSKVYYKVRWEGYGSDDDSWEPKRNLIGTGLIEIFEAEKDKNKKKVGCFEAIYPLLVSIIVFTSTFSYIIYSSQNKRYLPSLEEMFAEIIGVMAIQAGLYLTIYLSVLKTLGKEPKKLVRPYFELMGSTLLIASYNYSMDNYTVIFALRTYIHMFDRNPKYIIMLDSITWGLSWKILEYNMTNYKPTEGALRFAMGLFTIYFIECSRFVYFLYSSIAKNKDKNI